ncbi:MAG: CsbD family protein [Mesorhizobium amorphae]|nr:MAG: CsbD family protein [Mesorhizobium amorphae]
MNSDQVGGVGKQIKGAVKDAVGSVTGNEKLQAEGKADKAAGEVQKGYGDAKESVKDGIDKI